MGNVCLLLASALQELAIMMSNVIKYLIVCHGNLVGMKLVKLALLLLCVAVAMLSKALIWPSCVRSREILTLPTAHTGMG